MISFVFVEENGMTIINPAGFDNMLDHALQLPCSLYGIKCKVLIFLKYPGAICNC